MEQRVVDPTDVEPVPPAAVWGFRRTLRTAGMAAAALVWLAMAMVGGAGAQLDETVYRAFYAGGHPLLAHDAILLSGIGTWEVMVPLGIAAAVFLAFKRRMRAALLLIIVFGGRMLVELQKVVIDRDRPGISPFLEAAHSRSFPSGHSANSMITLLALALLLPVRQRMRAVAVGLALAVALQIGWSRVALGVHWPSDVVGGWAFGLLWVGLCMRLASTRPESGSGLRSR